MGAGGPGLRVLAEMNRPQQLDIAKEECAESLQYTDLRPGLIPLGQMSVP